ncbi:Bug family tripartite tricarboxylate transporter substrate binding protein [Ramlibacter alkalitolerans]|uniref:Tripartite tricarboxylate transporter substrate binding protein n=1 Tax=Ramlibacter alkalitolerans TaxID=2039631 RepID=A0ABS1JKK9_9BURK|nr:tripartite tricarboxylate transporter substrate binding protein [Ramlibacter alkalitolerans]MBL0424762.1 tripartite tricarboxylate transporter substrate binding protein [Ramlibacter alkalitolerans]
MTLSRRSVLAAATVLACGAGGAFAQPFPGKPIRLLVGFPPGGGVDIIARAISQRLGERLGQPVIVENRPGAGGNIAAEMVARAAPDGSTLLVSAVSSLAISASLYKNPRYDLLKDFTPVAVVASVPNVLVVNPAVKARNVAELIALAKANPGRINFGSAGNGTTVHFAGELFKSMADIDIVHVPYKGAAPAMSDLLAGQVQIMFDFLSAANAHIRSGKLVALGVTGAKRSPLLPNVPTIAEAGLPGYEVLGAFGVMAPAGTPPEIVQRLNHDIRDVVKLPDVRERLVSSAATPEYETPEEFAATLKAEVAKWARIVARTGVQLD